MDIPNGNWIFLDLYTDFRIGLRVSYECNEGYRLIGASEIICEESGYWSDNAPKCLLRGKFYFLFKIRLGEISFNLLIIFIYRSYLHKIYHYFVGLFC